jgi:protein-disulfide isomerase/uncharacterized membrane protein
MVDPQMTPRRAGLAVPIVLLVLCCFGMAVSALSTWDHVRFKASSGTQAGACAALAESGCAAAHTSTSAEFFGIPVSHLGTGFYFAVAALAVMALALRNRRGPGGIPPLVAVMGLGAVGYSIFLASILVQAGEACPFCIALYVVNASVLVIGLFWWLRGLRRPGLRSLFRGFGVAVGSGFVFLVVTTPFLLETLSAAVEPGPLAGASNFGGKPLAPLVLPARIPSTGAPVAEDDLVEFSDLECPHCAVLHHTIARLLDERGPTGLRVRFVNFPLDPACNPHVRRAVHPTACRLARAGICAQEQGRFWEFAEAAYELKQPGTPQVLRDTARAVGLDLAMFADCLDADRTTTALAEDIALAHQAGVRATPTILVNGWTFEGALSRERLMRILDDTSPCGCERRVSSGACGGDDTPVFP